MKEAFWALGIFVVGLLGLIIVNLFGNITVTNQFNYTTMKNAVEASMYDSLDIAHYRAGFCLCTDKKEKSGKLVFDDKVEYDIMDVTYGSDGSESCDSKKSCRILRGEYRIDKKVFSESLIRRFAELIGNNKEYQMVIQEVIEYPPKVSVRISSKDEEFSPTEKCVPTGNDSCGYSIVNQIDSIIEVNLKENK